MSRLTKLKFLSIKLLRLFVGLLIIYGVAGLLVKLIVFLYSIHLFPAATVFLVIMLVMFVVCGRLGF